jgi:hypothetical protein
MVSSVFLIYQLADNKNRLTPCLGVARRLGKARRTLSARNWHKVLLFSPPDVPVITYLHGRTSV